MTNIVCLDTNVLIWGIKQEATPGQEHMIDRAINFFQWFENERAHIVIPAIVLAEFLMRVPVDDHAIVIDALIGAFAISPADANVASQFARIWQINKGNGVSGESTREKMKMDHIIVATAIANNAIKIYSNDPDLARFAAGMVEVVDIPAIPQQLPLSDQE